MKMESWHASPLVLYTIDSTIDKTPGILLVFRGTFCPKFQLSMSTGVAPLVSAGVCLVTVSVIDLRKEKWRQGNPVPFANEQGVQGPS
jgi:hypothetical protein